MIGGKVGIAGHLEIVDRDTSAETPALMETGDVLFFHSYLMHMSTDNVANERRARIGAGRSRP